MAFYRLPGFIAETLSSQPRPPRSVPVVGVVIAVVAGADCALYSGGQSPSWPDLRDLSERLFRVSIHNRYQPA